MHAYIHIHRCIHTHTHTYKYTHTHIHTIQLNICDSKYYMTKTKQRPIITRCAVIYTELQKKRENVKILKKPLLNTICTN